ncbi:MAG: YybH family protein [Planctomycetota bacterium]
MLRLLAWFICCTVVLLPTPIARGDETAIRKAIDAYTSAFNRGDLEAMASAWTETAVWIHADGSRTEGLSAIRAELQSGLAGKATLEIVASQIRQVTPTVAAEEGIARLTVDGKVQGEERYEALHVATESGWKLASLREFAAEAEPAVNPNLARLTWLLGDWVDESEDSRIVSRVEWTRNNAFLINNFSAEFSGQDALEGVQVIGWDPAQGVIRSWMFDSDGAFGEGVWSEENGTWVVRSRMILTEGQEAENTLVYTPRDENSYYWQAIGRKVSGRFLPNIKKILVVRPGFNATAGDASSSQNAPTTTPAEMESPNSSTEQATNQAVAPSLPSGDK